MTGLPSRRIRGLRRAGALLLCGSLAAAAAGAGDEPPTAPTPRADRRWEGLVRRQDGIVFRSRRPGRETTDVFAAVVEIAPAAAHETAAGAP